MENLNARIQKNYFEIQSRIQAACARSNRDPGSVTLVAVTKYAKMEWVTALRELGCTDLGESRTPQLIERASTLSDEIQWHFIGPLQRNKVKRTIFSSHVIHSVDSLKLLSTIDRIAMENSLRPHILLEVNLSGEAQKKGFRKDELFNSWESICSVSHVAIDGLMTMAPLVKNAESTRSVFRELFHLREQLQAVSPPEIQMQELSMGMSGDFEVAIEEGATLVRIGSALYEGLESQNED